MKIVITLNFYLISFYLVANDTLKLNVFYKNCQLVQNGKIIQSGKYDSAIVISGNHENWFVLEKEDTAILFSIEIKNRKYFFSLNNNLNYDSLNLYFDDIKMKLDKSKHRSIKNRIYIFVINNFYRLGIEFSFTKYLSNSNLIIMGVGSKLNFERLLGRTFVFKKYNGPIHLHCLQGKEFTTIQCLCKYWRS